MYIFIVLEHTYVHMYFMDENLVFKYVAEPPIHHRHLRMHVS